MSQNNTPLIDIAGQRFGRLLAIERTDRRSKKRESYWRCICDCGEESVVRISHLRSGHVQSCGCLIRERRIAAITTHGLTDTKAYYAWSAMKQRCRNPKSQGYPSYGGRGITVCDRWAESFESFLADMGEPPDGSSLDRIDNNRGYDPGNCRWATSVVQSRNKRSTRLITANGVTRTLADWSKYTGIPKTTIHSRIKYGWTDERAVTVSAEPITVDPAV